MSFRFTYGQTLRDVLTGFEGQLVRRSDYITGCNTYLIQPFVDQNRQFVDQNRQYVESRWIDETRLEIVKDEGKNPLVLAQVNIPDEKAKDIFSHITGGDKPAPKR